MERIGTYGQVVDGRLYGPENGVVGMLREQGLNDFVAAKRNASTARTKRINEDRRWRVGVKGGS